MIGVILSSLSVTSWLVLSLTAICLYWMLSNKPGGKMPPTIEGKLPILGHLFTIMNTKDPRQTFLEFAKKYGGAYTFYQGFTPVVVLTGYKTIHSLLVKQANNISDRPETLTHHFLKDSYLGVLTSSGAMWKEQRTTSLGILRAFGMGKNSLAEKILEEVDTYCKALADLKEKPSDIRAMTNIAVSNITCNIIFGRRYDYKHKEFKELILTLNTFFQEARTENIANVYPFLRHLPGDPFKVYNSFSAFSALTNFCGRRVTEQISEYDADNPMDSFVSAYIQEIEKNKRNRTNNLLSEDSLRRLIVEIFVAGTETTSTTIGWAVLFLINRPDLQEKIYKEIVEVVGTERVPNMSDKKNLKFLQAFIMETQRRGSILPLSVPHITCGEVTIDDYVIPAGTRIFVHLDSVLCDPEVWGDPENFRPERFLDDKGNVVKREELIPFSVGRRVCLGEALAKMELFLFLACMLQKFKFVAETSSKKPTEKGVFGITFSTDAYNVRVIPR